MSVLSVAFGLVKRCRLGFELYMTISCLLDFRHADKIFTSTKLQVSVRTLVYGQGV